MKSGQVQPHLFGSRYRLFPRRTGFDHTLEIGYWGVVPNNQLTIQPINQ